MVTRQTIDRLGIALVGAMMICLSGCANQGPKASVKQSDKKMMAASFWGEFPANADPRVLGKKVSQNLLDRTGMEARNYGIIYEEVCVAYGAMKFAHAVNDQELLKKLVERYDGMLDQGQPTVPARVDSERANVRWVSPEHGTAVNMIPPADHVDRSVFGALASESYLRTNDPRYLAIGKKSADDQWVKRDTSTINNANEKARVEALYAAGLTDQTRWWIDDMYMITAVQVQAYRATKDKVYLDRAATEMVAYLDKLQLPNGLFYHREDVKFIWGRGDGWMAVGAAELLQDLPADHPKYARIMDGYKKMMAGLLKYQAADGMWRQLVDVPEAWPETSGTGMFVYGMAIGVKKGWLDAATYKEPVKKAWIALAGYLDEKGDVKETSIGTNAIATNTVEFYLSRQRPLGNKHGQAAFIWAAYAMLD